MGTTSRVNPTPAGAVQYRYRYSPVATDVVYADVGGAMDTMLRTDSAEPGDTEGVEDGVGLRVGVGGGDRRKLGDASRQ